MLENSGNLLTSYPYQNQFFKITDTGERVILRSQKSWFIRVSDQLKSRCIDELSTVNFCPSLNVKDSEQVHKDYEKIKKLKGKKKTKDDKIESYYINILEEIIDFNDWCVSEDTAWGIPIPAFKYRGTDKLLMDEEIISHFAGLVEDNGSSDIWYTFDTVDLLPPRYKNEADQLTKMYQVFDSWFDSSLSWQHVTGMGDPHKLSPIYDQMEESLSFGSPKTQQMISRGGGRRTSGRKQISA